MNKDNNKINDNELEKITGDDAEILISENNS